MKSADRFGDVWRFAVPWIHGFPEQGNSTPGLRWKRTILGVAACVLFGVSSIAAQGEQTFKGRICLAPEGRTPTMENGQVTLPCTIAHPKRGVRYILFNPEDKTTYYIDGHAKPKDFAGRDVIVIGSLDQATRTIQIDELFRALSPKIAQAKTVYIDCDACPRGMAAAWRAAFEDLAAWGKYDINPDPKKADLIFLFSANPYLGDYVTRDGPDKRPVAVKITYMNIVDPQTGQDLWGDSRNWGSFLVAKATGDLIKEFKLRLELENQLNSHPIQGEHRSPQPSPGVGTSQP
jgi:hypothetical protein